MDDGMAREGWEEEIFHKTRVQGFGERVNEVHAQLRCLWEAAQPMADAQKSIVGYIRTIRECNWRLEQAVWDLCRAIGSGDTTGLLHGHGGSVTDDRWQKFWAHYMTLWNWLPKNFEPGGFRSLLKTCDPSGETEQHVLAMLGDRTELKELYVERFCLWLDWTVLGGMFDFGSARGIAQAGAVAAVEERIRELDPDGDILPWLSEDGEGHTELCHHKAFRRYDIIISSIGGGKWRAGMPPSGTSAIELIEMHDGFIHAIEAWVNDSPPAADDSMCQQIHKLLGPPDGAKRFLASFLAAILSAQRGNLQAHLQERG